MKLFILGAAGILISGTAMAADLPARKEAPAPEPAFSTYNWNGFYLGGQVGYGWMNGSAINVGLVNTAALSAPILTC